MPPDLPPPPLPGPGDSLFLDVDGTLVALAERPDAVVVEPGLSDLFARLAAARPGRVALVSGRSVAQLDAMLGHAARSFAVAGSHGAEQRTPRLGHALPARPPALEQATAALSAFADEHGLIFEAKSLGAALHYRMAPHHEEAATLLASDVAATHGLVLQRGKMMVEVRLPGDKGAAIRALMETDAMRGTCPWFLGDDVTDEDGFAAATKLGGAGVLVGEPRSTAAGYRLDDVPSVHAWLEAAA